MKNPPYLCYIKSNNMKKITLNEIYLLKYFIYGGISAYDYSIGSKWTIAWLILAIFMLAIWIIIKIKGNTK